jgi:hypothetical protein
MTNPIDAGLRFFATIQKSSGETLNRETDDRLELLTWLDTHAVSGDALTVSMEATGSAVPNMIMALRLGALNAIKRL